MKQKIIDILQPNMIPEVAELKADQIIELFYVEIKGKYSYEYEIEMNFPEQKIKLWHRIMNVLSVVSPQWR